MMDLIRWNPLNETRALQNRITRLFDHDFFPGSWLDGELTMGNWKPAVDIYDNDDSIVIKAELPGVESKDVEVEVKDRVLTLKGERSHEKEVKEENYHRKERTFGKFQRSFTLPGDIDADKIKADYKDGILKIDIPKPEESKPKKILVH
jgi:HSP20 family protein